MRDNAKHYDGWLDRWAILIQNGCQTALDVGCGSGWDTHLVTSWSLSVTALDLSPDAVTRSRELNPGVLHLIADARRLDGLKDAQFDLVVASLSLHYLDFEDSRVAFAEVCRVLRAGGYFAFRVNAYDDYNFGAPRQQQAWQLVSHKGASKQFFTTEMLAQVLPPELEYLDGRKDSTMRFGLPKSFIAGLYRKRPNQAPQPTVTAVTPHAAHEARQP